MKKRKWQGRWISSGKAMVAHLRTTGAAPCLRKEFTCPEHWSNATLYLCGLGWHTLYINGQKADDRVLCPTISRYDRQAMYTVYDITHLLRPGQNAIAVLLGNGLYNCFEIQHWSFDKAPWRDWPKLCCDLEINGEIILSSDTSWKIHDSPIIFDALRNGEFYDARLTIDGFAMPGFDDSPWQNAKYCFPPGGDLLEDEATPCRITRVFKPVASWRIDAYKTVYDFGVNLTGWGRIKARGPAGTLVELQYCERVDPTTHQGITEDLDSYIDTGRFQCDRYFLRGDGDQEQWEPTFTYHGFRYIQVSCFNGAVLEGIEACFIHSDFEKAGFFDSSSEMLNALQRNTIQSFICNYTGIPTDCPHREKNGWTGDACLAAETGLWNFNARKSFEHFINVLVSCQRDNGQLPGIAPTGGYGYNWGNGPAPFDSILFEYPYQLYLFHGDLTLIQHHYDAMRRYLDYCDSLSNDNLVEFGLGDWKIPAGTVAAPTAVTSSGYYYQDALRMAFFANLLNRPDDETCYKTLAENIKNSFQREFVHTDGMVANDAWTALATALYFRLADEATLTTIAQRLIGKVRANNHRADFGTLGAKFIPRVLADYGFADDAFLLVTQPEFPGWGWQVNQGATTLWETWLGYGSRNHIMFGDISAWMYQYLGGLQPLPESPAFKHCRIKPCFVKGLDSVTVSHTSPYGIIRSSWKRQDDTIVCQFELPPSCTADLHLPNQTVSLGSGNHRFTI